MRLISHVSAVAVGAATAAILALMPTKAMAQTNWPQWGQNPEHQGFVDTEGQSLDRILADVLYDPNVPAEQEASGGDLLAHYQAPLIHQNDVFMEFKTGP